MNKTNLSTLMILCTASAAQAASFSEQCPELQECAKAVSAILGQKYVYDSDVKGKVLSTPNVELTKENAELLFTNALNLQGFSRVPLGQPGSYVIMRQRDARDQALPMVTADQKSPPDLPNNWDLYTMRYRATNPEVAESLARLSRSFMPANSRIIPDEPSGSLLITDTAMNLRKLYAIITGSDMKPSKVVRERWEEEARNRRIDKKEATRPAKKAPAE